jgi:serine/threonine protein kinase
MESNAHRLIGTQLGTCKLKQLIGFGGMGIVFLARQIRPSRDVAVKVLLSREGEQTEGKQEFLARFRREADVIAQLDHINILPIYEYGEQGGLAYLVMPYLEGGSLRDVLAKRAPLSAQEALTYTEQAAAALHYAHKHNIIHRDVKPGNMLFHADGRLVLVDFGIARIMHNTGEEIEFTLTSTGQFLGSVTYMAPEMVRGKQPDHRADIYELGVVLFEMLTGRAPFQGTSAFMIAAQHIQEEPPSLTSLNPNITPQVDAVVQKALAKDPDQRYSHANELALALRQALGMPTHIMPSPITPIYSLTDTATASLPGGTIAVEAEPLQSRPALSYPPNLTPRPGQVTPPNLTPRPAAALQPNMQRPIEPTTAQREQPLAPDDTTSGARLPQNIYTPPITRPPQNPYMPPQNPYIPPATTPDQTTRRQLKGVAVVGIIVFFLTAVILFGMHTLRSSTSSSQTSTPIVSVPTSVATAPTAPTPQITPPTLSPAQQAQDTIQRYYDDVNQADYKDAYQLWGTNYQQGHPYDQYAAGYATTQHVDIVFHSITALANGSQQVAMTIYARDTTANGSKISAFEGYYIVGQENGAWRLLTYQFVAK